MSSYWTNFAKSGDPNGEGLPSWPAYDGNLVLRLGNPVIVYSLPNKDRLEIFDVVYGSLRGKPISPR